MLKKKEYFGLMNGVDILVSLILLYGLINGFIKGFVVEIAGVIALVLGLTGSFMFSSLLEKFLSDHVNWNPKTIQIISFIILFITIVYSVSLLAKMVTKTLKIIALGWVNKLFGAVFGLLKWCVLLSVLVLFIEKVNEWIPFFSKNTYQEGISYSYLKILADFLFEWLFQSITLQDQQLI